LHGLGLISGLYPIGTLDPLSPDTGYLAQIPDIDGENNVRGWNLPFVYDSFIVDNTFAPITDYMAAVASFDPSGSSLTDFFALFKTSGVPFEMAQYLYKLANQNPKSLYFNSNIKEQFTPLQLYTSIPYTQASSISHLDLDTYKTTPNFIMIPEINPGITLDGFMKQNVGPNDKMYGVFGPGIMAMITNIGYSTVIDDTIGLIEMYVDSVENESSKDTNTTTLPDTEEDNVDDGSENLIETNANDDKNFPSDLHEREITSSGYTLPISILCAFMALFLLV
jgi:hypothetical protein